MADRIYILYDGRAMVDVDSASVLDVCESLEEAKENKRDYGGSSACYSYQDNGPNIPLSDQQFEFFWTFEEDQNRKSRQPGRRRRNKKK